MEDDQIIALYWQRSEDAIHETAQKYGKYCRTIAYNILQSFEDSEECVNDTWAKVWDAIPPFRPNNLAVFLGKVTRNLALDRYRKNAAGKRGYGQTAMAFEEITACIPASDHAQQLIDDMALRDLLNQFLASLAEEDRKIFMLRYWYMSSIKDIAAKYGITESRVKMSLFRSRRQLKSRLQKEGVAL